MISLLYGAFDVSLSRFRSHVVTFVVKLFALAKTYLHLYHRALKVYRYRYQRKPLLLDLAEKLHYLFLVHKQSADSHWIAVKNISVIVRRNMHSLDPKLPVVHGAPAVFKVNASAAYGLDLGFRLWF